LNELNKKKCALYYIFLVFKSQLLAWFNELCLLVYIVAIYFC